MFCRYVCFIINALYTNLIYSDHKVRHKIPELLTIAIIFELIHYKFFLYCTNFFCIIQIGKNALYTKYVFLLKIPFLIELVYKAFRYNLVAGAMDDKTRLNFVITYKAFWHNSNLLITQLQFLTKKNG